MHVGIFLPYKLFQNCHAWLSIFKLHTAQKMKFSIKDCFQQMWTNLQIAVDMVTFTEEILNGKLQ